MKTAIFPVVLVSIYLLVYVIISATGFPYSLVATLFIISPFLVIWMVFRVLRSPYNSNKTFDDHFYEDMNYRKSPEDALNA